MCFSFDLIFLSSWLFHFPFYLNSLKSPLDQDREENKWNRGKEWRRWRRAWEKTLLLNTFLTLWNGFPYKLSPMKLLTNQSVTKLPSAGEKAREREREDLFPPWRTKLNSMNRSKHEFPAPVKKELFLVCLLGAEKTLIDFVVCSPLTLGNHRYNRKRIKSSLNSSEFSLFAFYRKPKHRVKSIILCSPKFKIDK